MCTWLAEDKRTWSQRLATSVLAQGNIPKHVALILDGNRTYAKSMKVKVLDGHNAGFEKFASVMLWCRLFGVEEITAYLFSIENFNRTKDQLSNLHMLCKEAFMALFMELDNLKKEGIQVRIIGDWSLMPKSLIHMFAKIVYDTKDNKRFILNLAVAYTSRNEMLRAAMDIEDGIQSQSLDLDDITVSLLNKLIQVKSTTRPVDLLIRTSGVSRFSDYMLWQASFGILYFTETLWPALTFWDIWKAMYFYQRQMKTVSDRNLRSIMELDKYGPEYVDKNEKVNQILQHPRAKAYVEFIETEYWAKIKDLADYF